MSKKPPLGIIPKQIRDAQQIVELCRAIAQYTAEYVLDASMREWVDELRDLVYRNTKEGS
jgi:hypothetical protein